MPADPCPPRLPIAVSIDRVNIAYDLAERYRDFRSLVQLCNDPRTGSPLRVQFYIERYREDFAFALYTWYREQNRPFDLISQDQVYWPYLSKYLDQSELKRLSWLQSIAERKYEKAADALLEEASRETRLAEQKVCLSRYIGFFRMLYDTTDETFSLHS